MTSLQRVRLNRWSAVVLFLIYDVIQIFIVGHIKVEGSNNVFRYNFSWQDDFSLSVGTVILLLLLPLSISYLSAISFASRDHGVVQILGPKSLLRRIRQEVSRANPDATDLEEEAVNRILHELAGGEPPGTLENLTMLLGMGLEAEKLIQKSGVKSIKRVYMADQNIPNAFSLRVIPLPFIGQDWIIINRNVVDILDVSEIHSVIAHEIGHAAYYDSWVNTFLSSPKLIIIFVWSIIFARMAEIIILDGFDNFSLNRVIALVVLFILIRILMNLAINLTAYTHRQSELLCDYYAAKLVGSDLIVNALLKIGQRAEVLNSILIEFDWLEKRRNGIEIKRMTQMVLDSLSPTEISAEKAREYSLQSYVAGTLSEVFQSLKISVSRETFQEMVKESLENLKEERGMKTTNETVMLKLGSINQADEKEDWSDFDLDGTKFLDKNEIASLVKTLEKSDKRLFENEVLQKFGVLPDTKTHPQVSERIIFVYHSIIQKEIE